MEKKDLVFGVRAIREAIEAGKTIDRIFVKRNSESKIFNELKDISNLHDIPLVKVPIEKLDKITNKNHQGVIAFLSPVEYHKLENMVPALFEEGKNPICLILDGITDTRNFGAIARTCECGGVDFVLIPDKNSVSVTGDSIKTSAGALFHLPVCRTDNLVESVKYLQQSGYSIVGASEKASELYTEVDFNRPVGIVMGAEDVGISEAILKRCDDLAFIPIKGEIGSLNVSVAAGIFIYEALRQRSAEKR